VSREARGDGPTKFQAPIVDETVILHRRATVAAPKRSGNSRLTCPVITTSDPSEAVSQRD